MQVDNFASFDLCPPTKLLLVKHQPIPAQSLKSNEKLGHKPVDEIKYEQVYTFGDRHCSGTLKKKGERLEQGPSKASPIQENAGGNCKKNEASCEILREDDDELDGTESVLSKKQKRIQHYIPQQVQPSSNFR